MKETRLRRLVCNLLKTLRLDPISVENPAYPGTPDVNYVGGWIELKALDKWPVFKKTPLRIKTFTREQRTWLWRRWRRGGQVHLLVTVGNDWLLFDGVTAADHVGYESRAKLEVLAVECWSRAPQPADLLDALQRRA